jgi:hypothetical protein
VSGKSVGEGGEARKDCSVGSCAGCHTDCGRPAYDRTSSRDFSGWHCGRGEIKRMSPHRIADAEYAAAVAAGRTHADTEIRAQAVRYVPERDAIEIITNREAGFLIPRAWIGALQEVPSEDLVKLDVWPDGSAIEIEDRDIHISGAPPWELFVAWLTRFSRPAASSCLGWLDVQKFGLGFDLLDQFSRGRRADSEDVGTAFGHADVRMAHAAV